MLWAVWIGLAVGGLAVAFGVYRAARGLVHALRALRDLQSGTLGALESLARSAERLASHPGATPELQPALAGFNRSRAQLAVLLAAVDDVRDAIGRVTSLYPRK